MIYNYRKNSWMVEFYYTDERGHRRHLTKRGFVSKEDAKMYEDTFLLKIHNGRKTKVVNDACLQVLR